jgi:hypothetical protein
MDEERSSAGLNESDEYLHIPTDEIKWRESYYFNWVDLKNKISGFSTIGIVPNEKKREFVFFLFLPDRNEIYYKEPTLVKFDENIKTMLREKYIMIEPFKKWQIRYTSRKLTLDLLFVTRFPIYNFGVDSSASWHQHFEASGKFFGKIRFKGGEQIEVKGFGQRDKSWGYRDWHQFDKWYAGHFQFKTWSCAFRKDKIKHSIDLSGHISNNSGNISLKKVSIETIQSEDQFKSPISAIYTIIDTNDKRYRIRAERIKENSFIRFIREFDNGFTELFEQMVIMKDLDTGEIGSGMMEHLRTIKIK